MQGLRVGHLPVVVGARGARLMAPWCKALADAGCARLGGGSPVLFGSYRGCSVVKLSVRRRTELSGT